MCVCKPWNHRSFWILFHSRGVVHASTSPTKRLALNTDIGGDAHRRTCTFSSTFSNISAWQEAKPRTSFRRLARHDVILSVRRSFFSVWALLPLEDHQDPVVRTCTLRNWNPRPACGTAFSSVHPILSVFGLVPTRDEPATRRTGVCPTYPLPGYRAARSERRWPRPYVR